MERDSILESREFRNAIKSIVIYYACFSVFSLFNSKIIPDYFLFKGFNNIYLLTLSVGLTIHYSDIVLDMGRTKSMLMGVAHQMIFWSLLQGAKYYAFINSPIVSRHVWYLYYVPVLLIPMFSFYAAFFVGDYKKQPIPKRLKLVWVITMFFLILVLTNDLHGKVFIFKNGLEDWENSFSYGLSYYIVMGWQYILYTAALVTMFIKCRLSVVKKLAWVPIIPIGIGSITLILLMTGDVDVQGESLFQFTEVSCMMSALFWECCIQIGLIPTNKAYGKLMKITSLAAQIADYDGKTVYRSPKAYYLRAEQFGKELNLTKDFNTIIHCIKIPGGYGVWQDDVEKLNKINRELAEVKERLSEEVELIRLENDLKEKRAKIRQRTRVYDVIAVETINESTKINELAIEAEKNPEIFNKNMETICFLGVYIKRYANLRLMAANNQTISSVELGLSIRESLRHLANMGIPCDYMTKVEETKVPAKRILKCYQTFQELIEEDLGNLKGLYVASIKKRDILVRMVLEGAKIPVNSSRERLLKEEGILFKVDWDEGTTFVTMNLGEGEEL